MTDYYPTILGSASAGLISRVVCHPIDTIKSRLQAGQSAFRSVEGIGALYRGIGAVVVGGVPGVCIYMTTYEVTNTTCMFTTVDRKIDLYSNQWNLTAVLLMANRYAKRNF